MKSEKLKYKVSTDDEDGALHIRKILARLSGGVKYSVEHSDRLRTVLERLIAEEFDIIPLDLNLPDSVDFDTLERLLANVPTKSVIVLTGLNDELIRLMTINKGCAGLAG
jgi:DNA-binding response OmpR family regulator